MAAAAPTNGASQSYAQDLWNRHAQLKDVNGTKNALIEDVLSRYNSVIHHNQVSALLHEQTEYVTYLPNLMNANPFIVLDVDGNNFLFNDAL
ncbi:hypothetical protein MBLNU13_g05224t1 [Cladosporium sp. NU13]